MAARSPLDPNLDWKTAHAAILELAQRKDTYDADEAPWFVAGLRTRVWQHFGYASYIEYLAIVFGYSPKVALDRIRVAEALSKLPGLSDDLRAGVFKWSAIRELTRVALPETEDAWRHAARGLPVKEIERLVSGRERGDLPTDPKRREVTTQRVVLELSPETYATYKEAVAQIRKHSDGEITEEDALLEMSRQVLKGAGDAKEPSYQIQLTVCSECSQGTQRAGPDDVVVSSSIVEQARCDARTFEPDRPRSRTSIPPTIRRKVMARDGGRCQVPGCRCSTFVDLHHIQWIDMGGTHEPENLIVLCGAHHRAVHEGRMRLERNQQGTVKFFHADGTEYGSRTARPPRLQAISDAILALRTLGFTKSRATAAVASLAPHVGQNESRESIVTKALERLAETEANPGRQPRTNL